MVIWIWIDEYLLGFGILIIIFQLIYTYSEELSESIQMSGIAPLALIPILVRIVYYIIHEVYPYII